MQEANSEITSGRILLRSETYSLVIGGKSTIVTFVWWHAELEFMAICAWLHDITKKVLKQGFYLRSTMIVVSPGFSQTTSVENYVYMPKVYV